RKRHTKRPGGRLFPLKASVRGSDAPCGTRTADRPREGAYRHRCFNLGATARSLSRVVRRRSLPPATLAIGQQTARERPRVPFAFVLVRRSQGSLTSCLPVVLTLVERAARRSSLRPVKRTRGHAPSAVPADRRTT